MRLTVSGWARDCGTTEIFDIDVVTEARTVTGKFRFGPGDPVLAVEASFHPSAQGAPRAVTLHCHTHLRLGGDYDLKVSLTKWEIARLFYLTHPREIDGLRCEIDGLTSFVKT